MCWASVKPVGEPVASTTRLKFSVTRFKSPASPRTFFVAIPAARASFSFASCFAVDSDFTPRGLQDASNQLREFAVAENGRGGKFANGDLVQDLAGSGERLDKNGLFIGNVCRNRMEIFKWQGKIFGEGSVVGHNSKNGAFGAVGFQATTAEFANGFVLVGGAGNINFARDAFAQPALSRF